MIYQLAQSNTNWDTYLLDGPAGADLAALQAEWLADPLLVNLDYQGDLGGFLSWLVRAKHWDGVIPVAYDMCNAAGAVVGLEDLQATWGLLPADLAEALCPEMADLTSCDPEIRRHAYKRVRHAGGTRVWRCSFCRDERPITVPAVAA